MFNANGSAKNILYGLRLRLGIFVALSAGFAILGYLVLRQAWTPESAVRWLILAGSVLLYQSVVLGSNLKKNRRAGEAGLLPGLGPGNHMTLLRGLLVAGLVGFLFSPASAGLAYLGSRHPLLLSRYRRFSGWFSGAAHEYATRLGEVLDMSFDGLGVLAAALLAVQYGQVPVWYLSVAVARYVFLAGMWLRKISGQANTELPPGMRRRLFAGFQMGFIGVILLPVFSPPGTTFAAGLFAIPFLVGFGKDWFIVCGLLKPTGHSPRKTPLALIGPPALRLIASGLAGLVFFSRLSPAADQIPVAIVILELVAASLILLGVAGRISAVAGLILIGLSQQFTGLTSPQFMLVAIYTALLFAGTGALSLWAPEDRVLFSHLGEVRQRAALEHSP